MRAMATTSQAHTGTVTGRRVWPSAIDWRPHAMFWYPKYALALNADATANE